MQHHAVYHINHQQKPSAEAINISGQLDNMHEATINMYKKENKQGKIQQKRKQGTNKHNSSRYKNR